MLKFVRSPAARSHSPIRTQVSEYVPILSRYWQRLLDEHRKTPVL